MKYGKYLLFLFLPLLLSGCSPYTELNELGIIETIGIEKKEDLYLVSMNMIDAKKENDESDELRQTYVAEGKTITEAMQNIYLKSSKKIYLSHIEVLLLSEDVAKEDISFLVDFFLRNKQSRNSFTTVVVKGTTPQEIMEKTDKNPQINDIIQINNEEYGISSAITFEDFSRMLLEKGTDAVLPSLKFEADRLEIDGYAYFQENVFKGYLNKEDSLTYNLLQNKNSQVILSDTCPKGSIHTQLQHPFTKFSSKENKVKIAFTGNLTITENNCNLAGEDVTKAFEKQLRKQIESLLEQNKKQDVDLLGIESFIRRNHFLYYQKQPEDFWKEVHYEIDVTLNYQENTNLGKDEIHAEK